MHINPLITMAPRNPNPSNGLKKLNESPTRLSMMDIAPIKNIAKPINRPRLLLFMLKIFSKLT